MITERERTFSLTDGRYKFNLISVNEEGLSQETPVSFDIFIKRPFWRTWWFILAVIAAITGIVILIIRERDKAQKKIQEYLEKELEARTSVVMKQKGEIELQNLEITDSINYAKRIQSSILPDINKLKESFKDAFILFHPRDIVSGDFYWSEIINDKIFIAVADCTGHGVPGAFMSMLGVSFLNEIVRKKEITKASQVLDNLRESVIEALQQKGDTGEQKDGMDIALCVLDRKSMKLQFAGANNPLYIVTGCSSLVSGYWWLATRNQKPETKMWKFTPFQK